MSFTTLVFSTLLVLVVTGCSRPPLWLEEPNDNNKGWVAVYFLEDSDPCADGQSPVARWRPVRFARKNPSGEEGLREAMARLSGAPPQGLFNPLEGVPLDLEFARLNDGHLDLSFGEGLVNTARAGGSTAACAMTVVMKETIRHYYPDAESVCLLVRGESRSLFHDSADGCIL